MLFGESISNTLHATIDFNVTTYWKHTLRQSDVLRFFPESKGGNFASAFPDLYQATNGLKALRLDDIRTHLSAESTSSEVFEAFGLKIPAPQVTKWGTVVILCIQLYLYVYLRALKKPLDPTDKGWDVGWFAASGAILPRSIFFVTVLLLPLIVVVRLAQHAPDIIPLRKLAVSVLRIPELAQSSSPKRLPANKS